MSIEDKLDILQRIAEYSYTFDNKDAKGWANLFAEDGVWETTIKGQDTPIDHVAGREAILEWAVERHKIVPDTRRSFHHQSGTIFDDLTPDSARTRTMLILTAHDITSAESFKDPAKIILTGFYNDQWIKTSEGWCFAKRQLVM